MPDATTDAERVVTAYLRAINEREFSVLSDLVAESFTFTSPTAGTVRGRESRTSGRSSTASRTSTSR
jgi:hypothetical protein